MLDELRNWSGFALNLITLAGLVKLWLNQGEKQLEDKVSTLGTRVEKFETKLVDHDRRIQTVEGELKHLPDKDTVNELRVAMTKMAGDVGILSESMGSISRTVHRIDDYLRTEGKG